MAGSKISKSNIIPVPKIKSSIRPPMIISAIRKYDCRKCNPNPQPIDIVAHAINESELGSASKDKLSKELNDLLETAYKKRPGRVW